MRHARVSTCGSKLRSWRLLALALVCFILPFCLAAEIPQSSASSSGDASGKTGSNPRIPRLLFRSSEDDLSSIHPKFLEFLNMTAVHNPEYLQVYSSARDREAFIAREYPQYLDDYHSLIPGAYKSDLWRYLVVHHYGGIYNDIGMRYLRRIREVIRPDDEFVGAVDIDPTAIINGFFAAYPRHPIVLKTIALVVDNIRNRRYGCDNLDITGPRALARSLRLFFGERDPLRPIATGIYSLHGYKLHMLNFSLSAAAPYASDAKRGGAQGSVWDKLQLILEQDGTACLRNKFPGYMEAVYKNHSKGGKYGDMHWQRRVYRQSLQSADPAPASEQMYAHSSNLFRRGKEIWYHHNGTKYAFSDYASFLAMGMQECMAVLVLPPASALHRALPVATLSAAPGDAAANLARLGLWHGPDCSTSRAAEKSVAAVNVAAVSAKWSARGAGLLFNTIPFAQFAALALEGS